MMDEGFAGGVAAKAMRLAARAARQRADMGGLGGRSGHGMGGLGGGSGHA